MAAIQEVCEKGNEEKSDDKLDSLKNEIANEEKNTSKSTESNEPQDSTSSFPVRKRRDPMTIERCNLLNVCKLVVKELIDSSLKHGRMIDGDHVPLQQFFIVLEHVFRHGLKPKKGILRDKKEIWPVIEQVEKYVPDAADITTSVREMPNARTPLGRSRAWLRLAVMQKRLADYFRLLVEKRDELLVDYYEPGAIMLDEEAAVIGGLIVGLNIIDCNLSIKDEDLDIPMGVIDFSLYLRENQFNALSPEEDSKEREQMAAILDQKNYLEELNRHLNATVSNLQQKMESLQTANTLMKEDLAIAKNNILQLQTENSILRREKDDLSDKHSKQLEATREDVDTERETYQTSRQGLDILCQDLQSQLADETQMRLDVEKELELQISMKQEMEMALRLLEKDVHEKQDTVISIRKQLDDIKQINIDMYNKLQESQQSLEHKTDLVTKLEQKSNQMAATISDMEQSLKQAEKDKQAFEETVRKLGQQLADKDSKRTALETDLKIEREWRGTLQRNLEQEKERVAKLQTETHHLQQLRKEYELLQVQHTELQHTCQEQESALADLGSHLSTTKLKTEELREAHQMVTEASWADDRLVTQCTQCKKAFSVSRRKHHCRHCGEIYCNECSDNKMPLPSSAKPVRVCDNCQQLLLQRYSAN